MELWIRSQDKLTLVKVNQLEYDFTKIKDEERHKIITILDNDCFILGIYKTKEQALEVLDEIQNILNPKIVLIDNAKKSFDTFLESGGMIIQPYNEKYNIQQLDTYVYEMPKE